MQYAVLIPADETAVPFLVTFSSDSHIPIQGLLVENGGAGQYAEFKVDIDGNDDGKVCFYAGDGEENHRARKALHWLTDVHMVIQGPAAFVDIPAGLVEVIATGGYM